MIKCDIVVGLNFGDEGKGKTTDWLCRNNGASSLVVRYSGGHQVGHTVDDGKHRHVFQNFGSGTLSGVPTFWSRFCTFYPIGFMREYQELAAIGVKPEFYIDAMAPVTTVYDILYNQMLEKIDGHGSVGVGFGCTIARQDTPYKLYVKDLFCPTILNHKLNQIWRYYCDKIDRDGLSGTAFDGSALRWWRDQDFNTANINFMEAAALVLDKIVIANQNIIIDDHKFIIFEGAQGILLDMDHGFFPHVTRSNTTSKNAITILHEVFGPSMWCVPNIYYVTRSYMTRHGNGPFPTEDFSTTKAVDDSTNKFNDWQKHLRVGCLDLDLMRYAVATDRVFAHACTHNLCITHMDTGGCINTNIRMVVSASDLGNQLQMKTVYVSNTPKSEFDVQR
jgi:adenylosuccinate synthase